MESRTRDLESVRALRSARIAAVRQAASGDVVRLLSSDDRATRAVYVVKILDVHPRLGKVAGRRLLADIGVAPLARIADLTDDQRDRILSTVDER